MTLATRLMLPALLVGILLGALIAALAPAVMSPLLAVAEPIGRLWVSALIMTIVPLVFALLFTGIIQASATAATGAIAGRAMGWFAIVLVLSTTLGALVVEAYVAAVPVPAGAAALRAIATGPVEVAGTGDILESLLPINPVRAAAEGAMLPLVFFAVLFGLAAARAGDDSRDAVARPLAALADIMLIMVRWILIVAPAGILALALAVGLRSGASALGTLAHYIVAIVLAGASTVLLAWALASIFGRMLPLAFARAALPAQSVALGTQSSLGTLPAMLAAAGPLGVAPATAGFVLPLAVTLFRAATGAANVGVAVYLAHLYGAPPSAATLAIGIALAAILSVAQVGLPSAASFFTGLAPVCLAMGVPVAMLPVLLAVELIPDLFRTLGNVTADLAVTRIVGRETAAQVDDG